MYDALRESSLLRLRDAHLSQLSKTGHSAQNAGQAASSAKNLAKERIAFRLSSRKPPSSSSPRRFSLLILGVVSILAAAVTKSFTVWRVGKSEMNQSQFR